MSSITLTPGFIAIVCLLGLGVYGLVRFFAKPAPAAPNGATWRPFESVALAVAIFGISQLAAELLVMGYIYTVHTGNNDINALLESSPYVQFGYVFAAEALAALMVFGFLQRRKTLAKVIGVVRFRPRDIMYAVIGFGAYFGLYIIGNSIVGALVPGVDFNQKQELGFSASAAGPALVPIFISLVVLPPLVEELLIRGLLFTGLRSKLSFVPAMVITSIVFAAAHLQAGSGNALLWSAAIDTFSLSLVLVYLREKTASLWPGIVLHAIKNGIAFLMLFVLHAV